MALALAGCGGGSSPTTAPAELPRAVADELASKSDAIAAALDAGDTCKAAQIADELKNAVEAALSGGRVPRAFQAELERNAIDLQNEVNCQEQQHKDNGQGKKKGHKHHDETPTLGTTGSTTTGASD